MEIVSDNKARGGRQRFGSAVDWLGLAPEEQAQPALMSAMGRKQTLSVRSVVDYSMAMRSLVAAGLLLFAVPVSAEDNVAVNSVYDRMSAAYAARDRTLLDSIFHAQMVTSSAAAGQPAVIGGKALAELVGAGLDRLKQGDRQAELSFRITHRGWAGDTAVDLGVLRMRFYGGDREDRTVYSRFLSTLTRRDDGQWVFLSDSPVTASEADWSASTRFPGARFDP